MPIEDKSIKIKNIAVAVFVVFLVIMATYSVFWGPVNKYVSAYAGSIFPNKTFTASAEGKVTVSPDIAKFTFSVVSEGKDPKIIAENNNTAMNAAIEFVKSKGVDAKDIRTTQYDLSPKYQYDEKTNRTSIIGYTLTQTALVKVRNLSGVAELVGGLPDLGINQIGSISFDVDDPEKYLAEARKQAFAKAGAKAQVMASENGVSVGPVVGFWESSYPIPYYATEKAVGMGGGAVASVAPQIQPGSQEITVNVSVTYEIKQ